MPKRVSKPVDYDEIPQSLNDHPFFGLGSKLDKSQIAFRDAIWDDDTDIVFVDAVAGSGKTTIAVATSVLLCKYHKYEDITYVMHAVGDLQGFLPGTISEKSSVWFEGLYQALVTIGEFPDKVIRGNITADKEGTGYITAITDSYMRGSNVGGDGKKSILIIDEAQNFDVFSLRKVLTRACEGCKVIVIGHQLQCDMKNPEQSGFAPCMAHFRSKNNERFAFCELTECHRSLVAQIADEPWNES